MLVLGLVNVLLESDELMVVLAEESNRSNAVCVVAVCAPIEVAYRALVVIHFIHGAVDVADLTVN